MAINSLRNDAAIHDAKFAGEYLLYRLAVRDVLLLQDSRPKRLLGVAVQYRHAALHDDGAVVTIFVNEMHSAARDLNSVVERLLLRVQPRERRQQRRMDVQNAMRKSAHEIC